MHRYFCEMKFYRAMERRCFDAIRRAKRLADIRITSFFILFDASGRVHALIFPAGITDDYALRMPTSPDFSGDAALIG